MKKYILPTLIALGAVFIAVLIFNNRTPTLPEASVIVQEKVVPAQKPDPVVQSEAPVQVAEVEQPKPVVISDEPPSREVLQSRSMIIAHAPLRVPSVMDADSKENQIILQAMITKALGSAPLKAEYKNQKPLD